MNNRHLNNAICREAEVIMLDRLTIYKPTDEQKSAAEALIRHEDKAMKDEYAHIEHRWLRVYRRAAKKSQVDMAWEVFGGKQTPQGQMSYVDLVDQIENGEIFMKWDEFKRWASVCGHTGGMISLYYLPYRNWFQRLCDNVLFWVWKKFAPNSNHDE